MEGPTGQRPLAETDEADEIDEAQILVVGLGCLLYLHVTVGGCSSSSHKRQHNIVIVASTTSTIRKFLRERLLSEGGETARGVR